ncbi:hypothetical protein QQ045_023947 [Rhodiola kirilowii]
MDVLFIQETKMNIYQENVIAELWGNEKSSWAFAEAERSSGGLITIWDPSVLKVTGEVKGRGFILVQREGEKEKLRLWEDLVTIKSEYEGEWVVGGDFNSVLKEEERRGSKFNSKDAHSFQEFIQVMGVMDLPLIGRNFTWGNRNGDSRLDRFLVSPGFLSMWPNMEQRGLDKGPSDHAAVALLEENKYWGRKPFRLLDVWLEDPRIKELVSEAWNSMEEPGWKGITIQRKLSRVRRVISQWNKRSFGDVKTKLIMAIREWERLSQLQDSCGLSEEDFLKKTALQKRIWQLETRDERIWQKSRIRWLKDGDHNSKYFHRFATWRNNKKNIPSILVDGKRVEEPAAIKQAVWDYFYAIFSKSDPCIWSLEEMKFTPLNDAQKEVLERRICGEEILCALKDCDGSKAPGPDGFNLNFYKKYWCYVKEEVEGFIEEFCENGSPSQSAFIADRSILDDIMVINELIHAMKLEKRKALIIKLDFWKAYDSVSWEYLELVQRSMGFGEKWIDWMKECYSTARMAVLINGSPTKEFSMNRGLRQGDSLSPFLFLMAAEGLSKILNKAKEDGFLSGIEWVKNGDRMTHLQFADDTVLFCNAEMKEVQFLTMILHAFEGCSGLKINFGKSMCYGIGLEEEEIKSFAEVLGCPVGSFPMKYLGMQVGANPMKKSSWEPILGRFRQKLASWKSANLLMAGRVVLIKSTLCSLPLYYALIYKMPTSVALEMEKIQRQFLWGGTEIRKKVHYVKWSTVLKPKQFGGLGITGMVEKNVALLTKWWWKLITGKGGLWRRVIIEKYAIKGAHDPCKMTAKTNRLSSTWKNIIEALQGNLELHLLAADNRLKVGEMGYWLNEV